VQDQSFFFDQTGRFSGQRRRSYETTLKNFVGIAKNSEFVMPDLIRHPEFSEVPGFRPSPE
jgi:hypothetical protein